MKKIVVLISGQGQTLQAIIDACKVGDIPAQICAVIANKANAYGLQRAKMAEIPTALFERRDYADNLAMDRAIGDYITSLEADLIVLAGYMKILSAEFTQRFAGKILNIHPSLLPKYPGLNTYQQVLAAGEKEHGTTVHFVNEEVDGGAIILQAKVPIFPDDDIADIEQRVKYQEQHIYPLVINWFVTERLTLQAGKAYLDEKMLPPNGYATD
ncbi:phosphoribosylglycinamide formyltransferase [Avibacterium paragallinarum]|uniref:Phosphoribosylglycinamide formyltransferase n=1 Tax=Avibacterium paragallinarum TaxID=728 RepID=A0AAE5TJA8_AVIPA|nr:phosphoribosylglycinamide formyltransferase [Avibacterium paragallinarum]MEE3609210.1 phosphoribosylglycinamide formyltransferase [Avibacterium paragallinarum]MEE3621452.1 phosphoribosylglycinamide formyltransferase [Avibacterium paragallinarum]MEE3669845.1 phosphoribosylglycinamide formyltransferase [Avibacterium paragallinarum]MEE3681497.1 phosphoribosylglycinamide formyltransferase [Avibacterium paragallinarum]MEE4386399.1 phosphoribosylglycinamide formyltransferase [Avibacterium paragal